MLCRQTRFDDRYVRVGGAGPNGTGPPRTPIPGAGILANLRRVGHLWDFVATWTFDPFVLLVLFAVTTAYLVGARTVSRNHPAKPWPMRYSVSFLGGVAVIVLVTVGPVGSYDDTFFWAHMTQHILLMMLAAPLLLLGEPVLLVLRTSTPAFRRRRLVPVLRSRAVGILTNPVLTWFVFAGVLISTHVTGFFEYALEHDAVHNYVEHPLYLGVGLLYFYPLLGVGPGSTAVQPFAKVVSLFLMMIPEVALGFGIYTAGSVLYPYYLTFTDRPWGPSTALLDQRLGGAFMWSAGMLFHTLWISVAAWEWIKSEERKGRRIDAQIAAEVLAEGT